VALEAALQRLEGTVRQLEATVQHGQEQLEQNSRTSSRPPSSDPPQARGQRPRRAPTGRRPGGQHGHEGHSRVLVPIEAVDVVIPVKPGQCPRCQHPWCGEDSQPQRHQVTGIPPVRPVVTEYQLHRLVCPVRGEAKREILPGVGYRQLRYLNNRAENSHQPTRQREQCMPGFKAPGYAQRFLSAYGPITQHCRPRCHWLSAPEYRQEMAQRFQIWQEISGTVMAA